MRILGIDPGEKRIGIAISDPAGRVAVPVSVLTRQGRNSFAELSELATREGVELIVVGAALAPDGGAGLQARRGERFGRELSDASGIPVVFWDERFSSQNAMRALCSLGVRRRQRKREIDATAAAMILQDYLDSHPRPDVAAHGGLELQ
jgi:putative holliday junction resolvase